MIRTEQEYEGAKKALELAEKALKALQKELSTSSSKDYQIISEPYVEYIYKLRSEIDDYTGMSHALENTMPLWIRLKGPHISEDRVPISILSIFLDKFRIGVQAMTEYVDRKLIREKGVREKTIRSLSDFKIRIVPGSVNIGFSFPFPYTQQDLEGKTPPNVVEEAVKRILRGASWSAGLESSELEDLFPEGEERFLVLMQVDKLVPSRGSELSSIEFKGRLLGEKRVLLNEKAATKVKEAIRKVLPPETVIYEGVMREIDLDREHFVLRERPDEEAPMQCLYDPDMEDDAIAGLNKRVRIVGQLHLTRTGKPHHVTVNKVDILGPRET